MNVNATPLLWSVVVILTALSIVAAAALLRRHRLRVLRAASASWHQWIFANRADAAAIEAGCTHYDNAVLAYEIVRQLPLSRLVCRSWPHLSWSSQLGAPPNLAAFHTWRLESSPAAVPPPGQGPAPGYPLPAFRPKTLIPGMPRRTQPDGTRVAM